MSAVWMRARNELRTRWRAMLSLALIAGLGGGAAIAALAGARRTISAYPRFRAATHAFDELVGINTSSDTQPTDIEQTTILARIQNLPGIEDSSITDAFGCEVIGPSGAPEAFPDLFVIASPDGKLGRTLNAIKLESGRYADPARTDEAVVSAQEAQRLGARVGSTLTLQFPQVVRHVRVVGIGVMAGAVDPGAAAYTPVVILTPAFYAQNAEPDQRQGPTLAVRLHGGLSAIPALDKELAKTNADLQKNPVFAKEGLVLGTTISAAPQNGSVRRTALFEAIGLAIFGGLALITVLAIFGQLLARQLFLESDEQDVLRALGMSRSQLFLLSIFRISLVAIGAAIVSVGIAVVASPLFPFGFMRHLELSPGIHVDALALGLGAAGIVVLIVLGGIPPAMRVDSALRARIDSSIGTNKAANALAGAGFPPTAVAGVRMALEPGHGSSAVPVRTTIFGTVLALIALTASLSFGASLQRLVSTPSLSGWNFDAILPGGGGAFDAIGKALRSSPIVRSYTLGTLPNLEVNGLQMTAFSFAPGPFGPSIAAGRVPEGANEVAFGVGTLRALHVGIGQAVDVTLLDPSTNQPVEKPVRLRIVGAVVMPQFFFTQFSANYSADVSQELIDSFHIPGVQPGGDSYYVRFKPGIPIDKAVSQLRASLPANTFILRRTASSDLANLNHIANLPNLLAALLALVAAGTLAHTLVSSVRRRRKDVAVLRALGFDGRQVSMTVVWQATTIVLISLVIGLPVGAVAGRWAWRYFVDQLGYVPSPIVPLLEVLLAIPASLLLANLIASIPARAAARTQPAVVLRAE